MKRPTDAAPSAAASICAPAPKVCSIQSFTTGSDTTHMFSSGSRLRPTPSTTTMVFCRISSSGRVCMSNTSVYWNSWPKS